MRATVKSRFTSPFAFSITSVLSYKKKNDDSKNHSKLKKSVLRENISALGA